MRYALDVISIGTSCHLFHIECTICIDDKKTDEQEYLLKINTIFPLGIYLFKI